MITDFVEQDVSVDGARVHLAAGGSGPPVLLLHGFPQTHVAWRRVAPVLAEDFRMVCADLPGYGASSPPAGPDEPAAYAKRRTAATLVQVMHQLGHARSASSGTTVAPWSPSAQPWITRTPSSTWSCWTSSRRWTPGPP